MDSHLEHRIDSSAAHRRLSKYPHSDWLRDALSIKQQADSAALYLQGRRIQEVLREMREELRK
jgi:hypothetical protein